MKFLLIAFPALALSLLSCNKVEAENDQLVITASVDEARTSLDGVRILWDDTDAICINGASSSSVSVSSDRRNAQFTLPVISAPYYALYPASAYVSGSYAPASSKYGSLTLPSAQTYVEGSFDPSAALMYGYSASDPEVNFACGVAFLHLTVNSGGHSHAIKRIELSSNGNEDMSGNLEFDPSVPALVCTGTEGKGVVLSSASGIPLGSSVYIAIPARNYASGIKLRLVDVNNHYQDISSSKSFNAAAATVYNTSVTFNPSGTLVGGATGTAASNPTTKILLIGNSHNLDATDLLPIMLRHEGVRNVELTRSFHGGYYLVGYNTYYTKADNAGMSWWSPGQRFWNGTTDLTSSLEEIVSDQKYDIVVLMEYTGNSHAWTWDDAERNAIHGLIEKIRVSSPDAEFVYFQSHCWANHYETLEKYFNNNVEMFETAVNNNSLHVMDPAEGYPFTRFFSTAALIQSLRTSGLNEDEYNGRDMMRGDYVHMDYGLTRFAASLLVWKTLITPLTGIQPEDVTFRFTESYPYSTKFTTPVTEDVMPTILAAVNAAYNDPYHITDLSSYTTAPSHTGTPGSVTLDDTGVDVLPVSFPVTFRTTYRGGHGDQFLWAPLCIWFSTQPEAYATWIPAGNSPSSEVYLRTFAESAASNLCCPSLGNNIWTGDYFEFVIPVRNFKAGTTVRFSAPFYTRQGPCFWALDYCDGGVWKNDSQDIQSWDGTFTRKADFALKYNESPAVTKDVTFQNGLSEGFLRFRLRCVDGSLQAANGSTEERDAPYSGSVFYFKGSSNVTFSIVQ